MDGLPVCQVTKAGYISQTLVCFAPKPPPTRGLTTRIMDFGMPSALATLRRTWKTICVEETIVSRPKASLEHHAQKGSMKAC